MFDPQQPDASDACDYLLDPRLEAAEDLPHSAAAAVELDVAKLIAQQRTLGVRLSNSEWLARYDLWRELALAASMGSDLRERACRGCRGKLRYASRADAVVDARNLEARNGLRVSIYECWVCAGDQGAVGFHIGNTVRRLSGINGEIRRTKSITYLEEKYCND